MQHLRPRSPCRLLVQTKRRVSNVCWTPHGELCFAFCGSRRAGRASAPIRLGVTRTGSSTPARVGSNIDLGIRMLDVFLAKVPLPDEVLGVELAFVLELAHPVTGEVAPLPIIGAIDALVVEGGRPGVWELKTGKKKWSADALEYDPQMTAYSMAARELGHDNAELKLLVTTKTKNPDVQIERLVRHRADRQELDETALTVLHAVKQGIDYRVRGWACKTCAHAGVCGV